MDVDNVTAVLESQGQEDRRAAKKKKGAAGPEPTPGLWRGASPTPSTFNATAGGWKVPSSNFCAWATSG